MRIVVKVGTSTLAHSTGRMNIRRVEALCKVLSDVKNAGHEVILVSSGAIGMGVGKLSLSQRPADIPTKQAAAAVGQCELMYTYDRLLSEYNHTVAQLLVTGSDVEDEGRRGHFHNTLYRLLELGALPVINENDTIATDEIVIGDNDRDILLAVRELERARGGYTIIENGEVYDTLELPIMGLISDKSYSYVNRKLKKMIRHAHKMGVPDGFDPFITLSFMALPVIPEIRCTPRGMYSVTENCFLT